MTKNDKNKYAILTDEDMRIIQSDPAGLAEYVVHTKVKSIKKTAIIITILAMGVAFAGGMVCGMTYTKTSIPNNVVKIHVGNGDVEEGEYSGIVETEEGK